ncbi:MAG: hypothetical protein ABI434_00475 [Burkholderiaceae bacterium]
MNHKMAGSMQPVAMLAGMMARRLNREQPDIQVLVQNVTDMQLACKAAVVVRNEVLGWFHSSEHKKISIADSVAQCVGLLSVEFALNGCTIDNQTAPLRADVEQASVRSLLTATLFAVLDNAVGPMAVRLRAKAGKSRETGLIVSWTPLASAREPSPGTLNHEIGWDGVQAIADQDGVRLLRTPAQVVMQFAAAT